jgi:hypothetical protein
VIYIVTTLTPFKVGFSLFEGLASTSTFENPFFTRNESGLLEARAVLVDMEIKAVDAVIQAAQASKSWKYPKVRETVDFHVSNSFATMDVISSTGKPVLQAEGFGKQLGRWLCKSR